MTFPPTVRILIFMAFLQENADLPILLFGDRRVSGAAARRPGGGLSLFASALPSKMVFQSIGNQNHSILPHHSRRTTQLLRLNCIVGEYRGRERKRDKEGEEEGGGGRGRGRRRKRSGRRGRGRVRERGKDGGRGKGERERETETETDTDRQ